MLLRLFIPVALVVALGTPRVPQAQLTAPVPPIAAKAWLLLDHRTDRTIAANNADQRVEPASLTKLMTAYLVFDALSRQRMTLEQIFVVSETATAIGGARMFIMPGKVVSVNELLHGLIVQSANDAAIALAEAVAGSETAFVELMNEQAVRLGMTGTHFTNATGLSDLRHYSTAADLARLSSRLIRDFPDFLPLYAIRQYTYNGITQRNRNDLLVRDPFVDGLKTGHTQSAGYCLIATARRNERRMLAVVIGAASENARAIEAQRLLNYGFEFYDTVKLYAKGAPVARLPVWKGSDELVPAGFAQDFYVTVPRGQGRLLKAQLESMQPLVAPISLQQPVGVLRMSFADQPYGQYEVVALEQIGVANIFVRLWHSLRLLFR